jgi:alkaline phosphatase D
VTGEVVRREGKGDHLLPVVAECQPDRGRGARDQRRGDGRHLSGILAGRDDGARERGQESVGTVDGEGVLAGRRDAPSGRAKFRFSSYGDLATPSWDLNTSGNIWHESCDNSWYAVTAIENPGDGKGAPLFHLLNGDLCYANLDVDNAPGVWRDFGNNVARSAANRPWMPALGNHECEFGTDAISGHLGKAPGGIAAQGAAGNYWNGPYGFGHYLSRFLLPDNGVTNWDGNRLRGNFYAFQVGTVTFISLDADDVIYQDGAANYVIDTANTPPETTTTGASIPNGTTTYTRFYTGGLKPGAKNNSLVPDYASGKPNLQTIWLERTLAQARRDPSVDMIVVFMHQCAMSTSVPGNGSDLGIRQAWLPMFDKYEVDLVLSGHEHDYERTYPVRGYDTGAHGTVAAPNPGQTKGAAVDTRRPSVAATEPHDFNGTPAWNTAEGTVTWCSAAAVPTGRPTPTARTPPTTSRRPRSSPRGTPSSAARRPGSSRTEPTRSRTRPGPPPSTRPMPTATRSSTSTLAGIAGRPRSPSSTSRSRR